MSKSDPKHDTTTEQQFYALTINKLQLSLPFHNSNARSTMYICSKGKQKKKTSSVREREIRHKRKKKKDGVKSRLHKTRQNGQYSYVWRLPITRIIISLAPLFFFSSYATITNEEVLVNADKYSRQTGVLKM